MNNSIFQTITTNQWQNTFPETTQSQSTLALEHGQLIYFPHLAFHLLPTEEPLLSTRFSIQKRKNISYHPLTDQLHGTRKIAFNEQHALQILLARYATHARQLVDQLLPHYQTALIWGRTSYRPKQIPNRPISTRKDDKRLHVDAFPASPNQGKRILRVFCNINPHGEDRLWRIGEQFEKVVEQFLPRINKPLLGSAAVLKWLRITKSQRTAYDHYMLQIHDAMKADEEYQRNARQTEMRFPAGSTWIVQTDHVSHAAMSGQYMLEQTFYLPVEGMQNAELSPLRVLERKLGRGGITTIPSALHHHPLRLHSIILKHLTHPQELLIFADHQTH